MASEPALSGIQVVELESLAPAPFGCMLLRQLGATVTTVRRPVSRGPDLLGRTGPVVDPLQQGRHDVEADLATPPGRDTVRRLVATADVFVEGFRPGVTERLGLGPDDLLALNPALVYARMTGWGQDGTRASTAGHDINYLALTGVLHAIGPGDAPPPPPLNVVADFGGGGMLLAVGVLAALQARTRDGRGDVIDVAMVDGVSTLATFLHGLQASGGWHSTRGTNMLDGSAPFYTTYATADGGYVAVGAVEDTFYAALVDSLGFDLTTLPDRRDRSRWPELRELFARRFAQETRQHWDELLAGTDCCVTPVLSLSEAAADEHLRSRGTFGPDSPFPAPAPRFRDRPPVSTTLG